MISRRVCSFALLTGAGLSLSNCMAFNAPSPDDLSYPFPIPQGLAPKWRRQVVAYSGDEKPGTIVVKTDERFLFLVMNGSKAVRYGVAVGKQGFSWKGQATIKRKTEWPTWTPPREMIARRPDLAQYADGMPGSPANPLGARALYLYEGDVDTLYRIHGDGKVTTIGRAVSSGCVRLMNDDIADLYERTPIGTSVRVI